jgi:hypothetical protein
VTDIPHFETTDVYTGPVRYRDIWQRANLLLVCLEGADPDAAVRYRAVLEQQWGELTAHDTHVIVAADRIPGFPSPAIVIADRYGEVHCTLEADRTLAAFPPAAELITSLRFVQSRCPECEGEWR